MTEKTGGGILVALLVIAALFALSGCTGGEGDGAPGPSGDAVLSQKVKEDLLGTVITISSYETVNEQVFTGAFDLVKDIDTRMTANGTESEIARISSGAGETVQVSEDTFGLIEAALTYGALSGGAFDCTVGAVTALWKGADGEFSVLPARQDIEAALPLVDDGLVTMDPEGNGVRLEKAGMQIDLGAIAKGYACDRTVSYLIEQGVQSALLDFGGNIYGHGVKPDGAQWTIGIRAPLAGENEIACVVKAEDLAVVTSGGYERFFQADGMFYHHILNPETGYPAENGLLSVTVIDPSATRADALTTACFVLGLEDGYALLESMEGTEGIFITEDFELILTTGLQGQVSLADARFQIVEYTQAQ